MLQKLSACFCLVLAMWCIDSKAADLLQIFQQAYQHDPQFRMQAAKWHSKEQQALIAHSSLLPNLKLINTYNHQIGQGTVNNPTHDTTVVTLSLDQPIFDVAAWFGYKNAKIETRAFELEYSAALQDLMERATEFYFDALLAQYQLQVKQHAANDYFRLLDWIKARFKAGLAKSVDVDTVDAAYEQSLSDVIEAQGNLEDKWAHLQTITGQERRVLAPLKSYIPLVEPFPADLSAWIASVREKNLTVLANQYELQAKKVYIHSQQAGHYPTLKASINQAYTEDNSPLAPNGTDRNIMLTLSVPLYSGGKVTAQTRQAAYDYQALLEQSEKDYRVEQEKVQNNYEGVRNGIKRLQADQHIVAADLRALTSVNLAYEAGLKDTNMNNVIDARARLYQHRQAAFQHKRDYIVSLIKLKQAAGSLNFADLFQLNSWLATD